MSKSLDLGPVVGFVVVDKRRIINVSEGVVSGLWILPVEPCCIVTVIIVVINGRGAQVGSL